MRRLRVARQVDWLVFVAAWLFLHVVGLAPLAAFHETEVFVPPPAYDGRGRPTLREVLLAQKHHLQAGCANNVSLADYRARFGERAGASLFAYVTRARDALCHHRAPVKLLVGSADTGLGNRYQRRWTD